jgi:hypothetical protein
MRGSLGKKINQGGTADIHAWAPGQVVKLFKEGFPPRLGQQEARMTRAVFAAGAPVPEVFSEVTLDGRFGIVLSRLDGPTLLQLTRSGGVTFAQAGAILSSLGLSVHKMSPPPEAIYLRGWMDTAFRLSGDIVPNPHAQIDAAGWSFRPASSAQVLQRRSSADLWEASVIFRPAQTLAASHGDRRPISQRVRRTPAGIGGQVSSGWIAGRPEVAN